MYRSKYGCRSDYYFHNRNIAHREEISNLGLRWATAQPRGTVTEHYSFYSASTNDTDLAHLFGSNGDGGITVTKEVRPTVDTIHDAVYSFNIDHAPNADGVSQKRFHSGIVTFRPRRTTLGAWCSMRHSLDSLVSGLSFSLHAPLREFTPACDLALAMRSHQCTSGCRRYFSWRLYSILMEH